MVKNGQAQQIRALRYEAGKSAGLEVLTFDELRAMSAATRVGPVLRADFHVVACCTSGHGRLLVDFVEYQFNTGDLVWIRPGRTHRWDAVAGVHGHLVLFRPEFVSPTVLAADPPGSLVSPLSDATTLITQAIGHLSDEYAAVTREPFAESGRILRNLLEVVLLRAVAEQHYQPGSDVFDAFARSVERHHPETRELSWYAAQLGYSARTLSRACHDAVGTSAKRFIDDRVVLEAKRLLVHGDLTASECARRLGFDDPANFAKFFRTRAGKSPGAFKSAAS